jgi:hypothetical protein
MNVKQACSSDHVVYWTTQTGLRKALVHVFKAVMEMAIFGSCAWPYCANLAKIMAIFEICPYLIQECDFLGVNDNRMMRRIRLWLSSYWGDSSNCFIVAVEVTELVDEVLLVLCEVNVRLWDAVNDDSV